MRNLSPCSFFLSSAILILVLPVAVPCAAQGVDVARMQQIVESYVANHRFMGAVLVAQGNKVLLDKGYGYADLEWQIPDSPDTKFRLGSITKQFTAAAILLLEQRGKLSTGDTVKKYIPNAPAAWDKITIYNLLTHTSGIPNFTSFPDYGSSEAKPATPEQLVNRFLDKPLDFAPGEKWSYSNSGYVLLGYLIEKITGEYYQTFLEENLFKPLGMNDTGYDSNVLIIPHRAVGYVETGMLMHARYIDMTIPFSAGGLYSTTHDLLQWNRALYGGKVLSSAELKKMTTPYKNKDNYACGLWVRTDHGHTVFVHAGGIEGFNTSMAYYPDEKLTVIALGNVNGNAPDNLVAELSAVAHGETVVLTSERKEITVAPEILAGYVGAYQFEPASGITISLVDNHLSAQGTGMPAMRLFAESPRLFFIKDIDAQIEFFTNDKGQVTYLVLHQPGRDNKGIKQLSQSGPQLAVAGLTLVH